MVPQGEQTDNYNGYKIHTLIIYSRALSWLIYSLLLLIYFSLEVYGKLVLDGFYFHSCVSV